MEFKLYVKRVPSDPTSPEGGRYYLPDNELLVRGSEEAAGWDLRYAGLPRLEVKPGEVVILPTSVSVHMPKGWLGFVRARSGHAFKFGFDIKAGIIDSDYRGEIRIIGETVKTFVIEPGDRCGQIVFLQHGNPDMKIVDELPASVRGSAGYGSTGVR